MKIYRGAVNRSIIFYERYMLPPDAKRKSLLDIKRAEFKDRKHLLNPYQSDLVAPEIRE